MPLSCAECGGRIDEDERDDGWVVRPETDGRIDTVLYYHADCFAPQHDTGDVESPATDMYTGTRESVDKLFRRWDVPIKRDDGGEYAGVPFGRSDPWPRCPECASEYIEWELTGIETQAVPSVSFLCEACGYVEGFDR